MDSDIKFIFGILVVGIIGIVAIVAVLGYWENSNSQNLNSSSATSSTGIQVVINYTGNWQGSINVGGGGQLVEGTGSKTFNEIGNPDVIGCDIHKTDGSSNPLTVSILQNGTVIRSSTTTDIKGSVAAAYSFIA